ncbi:MAG: hypothetical protein DMF67_15010 [Acidobacteria bacterium]|nr:MAG: hypothetical protein DMF67_15010 [Acidobacteriota bacterium]
MKKAEGRRQTAVGRRRSAARLASRLRADERSAVRRQRTARLPSAACLLLTTFCLLPSAFLSGCAVDERRGVPAGAQATVDRVTEDIAAGRDAKVYGEAADEWRAAVSADENGKILARVRERLGRVESRALHTGHEQQSADPPLSGHALELVYQTRFERGSAMEKFTLLERGGDWLLAGYSVNSDLLKQ